MSDSQRIKSQYLVLGELKRVDEKIARLEGELARIPDELHTLETELLKRQADFIKSKTQSEIFEKKLRQAELELKDKEERLRKASDKMMEVKTNEEYQAGQRELLGHREEKSKLEDEVLTLLTQVEEERKRLKESEKEFKNFEAIFKRDKQRLDEDNVKLLTLLNEHRQHRGEYSVQLDPSLASAYQRELTRARGVVIVGVENGMCMGCHMKLRPQLYNEILGFLAVHRCSNCGRILVTPVSTESDAEVIEK